MSSDDEIEEREKQGKEWKGEAKQRAEESAIARRQSKYQEKEKKN